MNKISTLFLSIIFIYFLSNISYGQDEKQENFDDLSKKGKSFEDFT